MRLTNMLCWRERPLAVLRCPMMLIVDALTLGWLPSHDDLDHPHSCRLPLVNINQWRPILDWIHSWSWWSFTTTMTRSTPSLTTMTWSTPSFCKSWQICNEDIFQRNPKALLVQSKSFSQIEYNDNHRVANNMTWCNHPTQHNITKKI